MGNLSTNKNLNIICRCFKETKFHDKDIHLNELGEDWGSQKRILYAIKIQSYFRKFMSRKRFFKMILGKTTAKTFEEEFYLNLLKTTELSNKNLGSTELNGYLKSGIKRVKKSIRSSLIFMFIEEERFPDLDNKLKHIKNMHGKNFMENFNLFNAKIVENIKNSNIIFNLNIEKSLNNIHNNFTEANSPINNNVVNSLYGSNMHNVFNNSNSNIINSNVVMNNSKSELSLKKVTVKYSDNSYYKGYFNWENKRENFGLFIFKDKSIYEGNFLNNQMEGYGRIVSTAGDYYEGGFINNKFHGEGLLINSNPGLKYKGEFSDGLKHGEGEEYFKLNVSHNDLNYTNCIDKNSVVNFNYSINNIKSQSLSPKNNKKDDINNYISTHSEENIYQYYYIGSFKNNRKNGKGKLIKNKKFFYEGSFHMDQMDGKGIGKWIDGRIFNGEWKNDKMHGNGVFQWPDGDIYIGQYTNDKKNGVGIFIWKDKQKYEGYWLNGKQHGFGMFYNGDSTIYGEWEKGELKKNSEKSASKKNVVLDIKHFEIKNTCEEIKKHFSKFDSKLDFICFEIPK